MGINVKHRRKRIASSALTSAILMQVEALRREMGREEELRPPTVCELVFLFGAVVMASAQILLYRWCDRLLLGATEQSPLQGPARWALRASTAVLGLQPQSFWVLFC